MIRVSQGLVAWRRRVAGFFRWLGSALAEPGPLEMDGLSCQETVFQRAKARRSQ